MIALARISSDSAQTGTGLLACLVVAATAHVHMQAYYVSG